MGLFGMFIQLEDRECLVVGGGAIGTRKVQSILDAGGRVTVISPEVTVELRRLIDRGVVKHIKGTFSPEHLDGKFLCISAVNDGIENEAVARICRERGILVNVVDDPVLSDFFFPSVVRRGDLVVAVSSGGTAPSMVKQIGRDIAARYGPEYEIVFRIMGRLRESLRSAGITGEELSTIMERAAALPLAELIAHKKGEEINRLIRETFDRHDVNVDIHYEDLIDTGSKE